MQSSFSKFRVGQPIQRIRKNNRKNEPTAVRMLTQEEADERNRQQYLSFVANWRKAYNASSNQIRALKIASKNKSYKECERQEAMRYLVIARAQARALMISRESIEYFYLMRKEVEEALKNIENIEVSEKPFTFEDAKEIVSNV